MRRSFGSPMAAVVISAVLCLLVRSSAAQQRSKAKDASSAFAVATRLFEQKQYAAAISKFRLAYRLKPHYSVRCNIALCHERLGDYVAAADEYKACLAGASTKPKRVSIRKALEEVKSHIGTVKVRSSGNGEVYVDGRLRGPPPKTLRLNPGRRVIEVRRLGARSAKTTIVLRGGEQLSVELEPTEVPVDLDGGAENVASSRPAEDTEVSSKGISQAWFWTMTGATIALAVTTVVLGVQTLGLKSEFEDNPTQQSYDRGVDRRMATNIVLTATAIAATSSTVLFFYTDFGKRSDGGTRATAVLGLRGAF